MRCTKAHRATPLQHELLCWLAVQADATVPKGGNRQRDPSGVTSERAASLLQQVLGACAKIHGRPSTHVTLAVALAEKGLIKELRNFLMVRTSLKNCKLVVPLPAPPHAILAVMFMINTTYGLFMDFYTCINVIMLCPREVSFSISSDFLRIFL